MDIRCVFSNVYFSPDTMDVAVDICLQVWHSPAPVDQEQTNAETGELQIVTRIVLRDGGVKDRVKENFENCKTPEDDLKDGPGEVAPEADVAEAKGLHDLVQVLHVLPEISIQFRAQEGQYVPNLLILKLILR